MTRHRLPAAPIGSYLVMFLVCMITTISLLACTQDQRQSTIRNTLVTVNAARDGFTTWDRSQQDQIVKDATSREEGVAKLTAYRAERADVVADFEIVYRALAVAATQVDELSLKNAQAAASELIAAIDRRLHPPAPNPALANPSAGSH